MNETILPKDGEIILKTIGSCLEKKDGSKVVLRRPGVNDVQILYLKGTKNITLNVCTVLQVKDINKITYNALETDCEIVHITPL